MEPKPDKNTDTTAATGDSTTEDGGDLLPLPRLSSSVLAESMALLEDSERLDDDDKSSKETAAAIAAVASTSKEGTPAQKPKTTTTTTAKASRPTAANSSSNNAEAVSVERKEELLLEARVNRLQWIHRVPLPYRKAESPDDPWVQEKGLASFLKTCHAAALMPSTTKVLSHLYGMEDQRVSSEEVANRIESLVRTARYVSCEGIQFYVG